MSLPTKLGLGTLCALLAAIVAIAVWPASVADKAREDGEQLAAAVSDWDQELYEAELDIALDDLADGAEDLREDAPEVAQAFWDGFDDGLTTT